MGLDSWSYFYIPSIETVAAHHMVYHKRWNTHQNNNNGHISHPSPKFHQKAAHHHRQSIEIGARAAQFWWPSIYNHMEQRQVGVDVDKRRLTVSSKEKKMFDGHINARHQVFAHFFFTLCFVLVVVCVLWCGHRIHPKRSVIIRRWAFWFGFRHFNHPPFIIKYYHNSIWCAQHSNRPTIRPEAENFCKRRVMPLFQWL